MTEMGATIVSSNDVIIVVPAIYKDLSSQKRRAVREKYITMQEGKCYYCDSMLTAPPPKKVMGYKITTSKFPKSFFNYPVHLHHDHDTGLTIGAVHAFCNAVLWQYHGE